MKIQATPARRSGFTLVELLVVIAIIVALAALALAGVAAAINKAKKTQALHVCTSLVQAVNAYYDTYGALPDLQQDLTTDSGDGTKLINILMALETPTDPNVQNPKGIRFFEAKEAKKSTPPTDGVKYTNNKADGLFDPWGFPYHVKLDNAANGGYDEILDDPFNGGSQVRGVRVLVYSLGKNNKPDGGKGDDVKSW